MPTNPAIVTIPAQVTEVKTLEDRSLRLKIETALEVDPIQMTVLFNMVNKQGWFGFSESPISAAEMLSVPEVKKEFPSDRTPSERLRAVIYKYHQQQGGKPEDFELFYRRQVEKLINVIKEKLV